MHESVDAKRKTINYPDKVFSPTKEKKAQELSFNSVEDLIYTFTGSEAGKTIVIETISHSDINTIGELGLKNIISLKRINDLSHPNKFFEAVNKKLPYKGIFICCAEFKLQFPSGKFKPQKTKIDNEDSIQSSILPMLKFNGFKVNYSKDFNNLTYLVTEKISEPLTDIRQKIKFYSGIKIFVDFFVVFTSLTFLFPVLLLISIGIKIDSRGPLLLNRKE